ncbi:hypothetical protein EVAR_36450_1 [Eumeta japonica]|uniref:Uncharacterized protein n=1 Tax=Eumeta variegata TaxID=151549 RepID=A0A4C1VSD0_EUMVA|nr:hypothetical protein EVAR_36450_1 [Eumeta japonica]
MEGPTVYRDLFSQLLRLISENKEFGPKTIHAGPNSTARGSLKTVVACAMRVRGRRLSVVSEARSERIIFLGRPQGYGADRSGSQATLAQESVVTRIAESRRPRSWTRPGEGDEPRGDADIEVSLQEALFDHLRNIKPPQTDRRQMTGTVTHTTIIHTTFVSLLGADKKRARGRPIIVEWERRKASAGLSRSQWKKNTRVQYKTREKEETRDNVKTTGYDPPIRSSCRGQYRAIPIAGYEKIKEIHPMCNRAKPRARLAVDKVDIN